MLGYFAAEQLVQQDRRHRQIKIKFVGLFILWRQVRTEAVPDGDKRVFMLLFLDAVCNLLSEGVHGSCSTCKLESLGYRDTKIRPCNKT